MDIVRYLTTPGNFVRVPSAGRIGCVRAFDATLNTVEVSFNPIGFAEAMSGEKGSSSREQFLAGMRVNGTIRSYHVTKLSVPSAAEIATLTGASS